MPLFGKSKKAAEAKKQEEKPAEKPAAAYRHVPKHAASDARNHGLADSDRAAQQKRIMAASQSRLNSMNSNYSVKSNFNDVPVSKGGQSKPFVLTASSSSRQSVGSAIGRDRAAVQPGGPAGTTKSPQTAQQDYVKLRNPSLLSNTTAPRSSSPKPPATVNHRNPAGAVGSSDSGYGSAGRLSRPDSKAPSTISKPPSEHRVSQDAKATPRASTISDFLPKLDFSPESAPTTSSTEPAAPSYYAAKSATFTSRDRGMSGSSSYISRLDPGSDRRSVASFSSRPFDQIDFSKPGNQIVSPITPTKSEFDRESELKTMARTEKPAAPRESLPAAEKPQVIQDSQYAGSGMKQKPSGAMTERRSDSPTLTQTASNPAHDRDHDILGVPAASSAEKPAPPQESAERIRETHTTIAPQQPIPPRRSVEPESEARPSLQLTRDQMINTQTGSPATSPPKEQASTQNGAPQGNPQFGHLSNTQPEVDPARAASTSTYSSKDGNSTQSRSTERGTNSLLAGAPTYSSEDKSSRRSASTQRGVESLSTGNASTITKQETSSSSSNRSASQTAKSEQPKASVTGRHRNWSRPSQSSGSQLDYVRSGSDAAVSESSERPNALPLEGYNSQKEDFKNHVQTRDFINYAEDSHPVPRTSNVEQASQPQLQQRWNDQASSVYGESSYVPSTRQHSPSRRHSLAPSEILDPRGQSHSNGRPALAPLGILDGLKVNKRGKILDEEGDPIGELVEGDIIDCVRQKANAFGQVLDDYGRVVGRVTTINRGAEGRCESQTAALRSRGYSMDVRRDLGQYVPPESHLVSPATPTLGRPFEYTQQEDPRQRAADLQAAAARRNTNDPEAHIELDASGYAEAAPLVDHSEIFAPPFIPSRSPKRSPAETHTPTMDSYFTRKQQQDEPPPEEHPRLKKWASRNLEQAREEMQTLRPAPAPAVQPPSEHTVSRPSTRGETPGDQQNAAPSTQGEPAAQDFISSDQPRDIFPWMSNTAAAPQESGKWSANAFTYKGENSSENAPTGRKSTSTVRTAQTQNQPSYSSNGAAPKQYTSHATMSSAGSRKSNRTSYQTHVKSPLSTHSTLDPNTNSPDPAY